MFLFISLYSTTNEILRYFLVNCNEFQRKHILVMWKATSKFAEKHRKHLNQSVKKCSILTINQKYRRPSRELMKYIEDKIWNFEVLKAKMKCFFFWKYFDRVPSLKIPQTSSYWLFISTFDHSYVLWQDTFKLKVFFKCVVCDFVLNEYSVMKITEWKAYLKTKLLDSKPMLRLKNKFVKIQFLIDFHQWKPFPQ